MRKFSFILCFLFTLLLSYSLYAQTRTVKGKVIDSEKKPISGASILIKGKTQGTAADAEGNFTLKVPEGRVQLEISSVGYLKREVNLRPDESEVTIEMRSDSSQLKDVVVTALGITRQAKTLVYATQNVKVSELTGVRASDNVLNSLQGKIANAVINQGSGGPGSGARIVLRGNRSIQGDNNALIVVDGVPIENNTYSAAGGTFGSIQGSDGASNINPDDIESVTVLRGASAAALYGSQAGNGVIVITTKKGSKDKLSVNVNSGAVFESAFALPKVQNTYGQGNNNQYVDSLFGDSWGAKMTGQTYTNFLGQTQKYAPQSTNIKDFFRTGLGLNNSISVSGGNSKAQTYLSYTNNSIQGIIPKNVLLRHTITLRVTNQISSKFSTDAKITYINQDIKNKPRTGEENSPVIDIFQIPRNISLAEAQQYQSISNVGVPNPNPWPSTLNSIYQNPYWMINNSALNETRDRVMGFLSAKYQITPWLSVTGRANLDRSMDKLTEQYAQGTLLWANQAGGYFSQTNIVTTQKWFDAIFDGSNKITENFKANYHFGAIYQDNKFDLMQGIANGLNVTNKFSLNYATNPALYQTGTEVQTQAVFAQANFSYKDAIYLDASIRNDWDSRLPAPYAYQYYSVGASALISDLVNLPDYISFLKASLNYAEVGNGGQFGLLTSTYSYSQGAGNGFLSRSTTLPIPGLKPEIVKNTEAGIEARFNKNKWGFTFTYYKSNSFNQLLQIGLPTSTGYARQYINAGNIQNQGIEVVLNATAMHSKNFNWDVALNFALNRNKVISLSPELKTVYFGDSRAATMQIQEGGRYGDLIGFKWLKDSKGRYEVNADGTPLTSYQTGDPQAYIGNFNPNETVGLTNTFRYKDFSLRVLVDGRIGGVIVDGTEMNLAFSGIPAATAKYREGGWSLGGVDANGNAVTTTINAQQFWQTASGKRYGVGDFFAYDATSFRVRELSLGYDIPLKNNLFIKAARLSAVARNLFWLYRGESLLSIPGLGKRKMTFDPDMSLGNGNYQGITYGTLPATRSIGVNLQLTF